MKSLLSVLIVILFSSCSQNHDDLDFLIGTWKRENAEQYEVWERDQSNGLNGYTYKMNGAQRTITETLSIIKEDQQVLYEATVPDQNEGRTIQFKLNSEIDSLYSFENANHDFPKKIQYKIISETLLKVIVLGDGDEGFSYIQIKQ